MRHSRRRGRGLPNDHVISAIDEALGLAKPEKGLSEFWCRLTPPYVRDVFLFVFIGYFGLSCDPPVSDNPLGEFTNFIAHCRSIGVWWRTMSR